MALIATVEDVAIEAGLPTPLPEHAAPVVAAAVRNAQADLEAYLGRAVEPRQYVDRGVSASRDGQWLLTHDPVVEVLSAVPETFPSGGFTGLYTVTYRAGLDGVADPELEPLRRFVRAHAAHSPQVARLVRQLSPDAGRVAKSVSVEGQSVTYESATPPVAAGSGMAGAVPALSSCDRWRVAGRRAYQRPGVSAPWPYGDPLPWSPLRGWW